MFTVQLYRRLHRQIKDWGRENKTSRPFSMKPYTALSIVFLAGLCLLPPIDFFVRNPMNDKWFWMICVAGFFGVLTLFIKTNWFLRIIAVGGFINCFFSCAPYLSFSAYVLLITACYFYIIASRIENWTLVINCIKSIFILNGIIMVMQVTGHDHLLNFGVGSILPQSGTGAVRVGIIGQHMQMASFSVMLTALLVRSSPFFLFFPVIVSYLGHSSWGLVSSFSGVTTYLFYKSWKIALGAIIILSLIASVFIIKEGKIDSFFGNGGRYNVWKRTVELSNQHPFTGWGIGTFKSVFPAISGLKCIAYGEAHNCWLQFAFEIGYLGMAMWILMFFILGLRLFLIGGYSLLAGLVMIAVDMIGHFPTRIINCVPLLILFAAYSTAELRKYERTAE